MKVLSRLVFVEHKIYNYCGDNLFYGSTDQMKPYVYLSIHEFFVFLFCLHVLSFLSPQPNLNNEKKMTTPRAQLPIGRINTIMRSSSDVENVGKDSVLMMSKAAELFIKKLVVDSFNYMKKKNPSGKTLRYQNLAAVVQSSDKYHFLKDMTPMKITVREYKKIMARKNGEEEAPEEISSESESDDGSSINSSKSTRSSSNSVISIDSH